MNTNIECVWMYAFAFICICINIFKNIGSGASINQCKLSWKLSSQHSPACLQVQLAEP